MQCEQEQLEKFLELTRTSFQFRDVSRAMHVRPQVTLNAHEVEVVLGLLTRNVHDHWSRISSISGTEFVGFFDDAIESILEATENMNLWDTDITTMTNDTSSVSDTGATSLLSASQSGATRQSKAFVSYCSNNTELQSFFVQLTSSKVNRWSILSTTSCFCAKTAGHVF